MADSLPYEESEQLSPRIGLGGSKGPGASFDTSISDAITTTPEEQRRRTLASACGFQNDERGARVYFSDPSPKVRSAALGALARLGIASVEETLRALHDPSPMVRRTACELATSLPIVDRTILLRDDDPRVVEACAFALGELHDACATLELMRVARTHEDPLCREAAVAALGAVGDERATSTLLESLEDIPQIRRRSVIALSNFKGDQIDRAIRGRLVDKDWQVRQAAEDILGVNAAEQP